MRFCGFKVPVIGYFMGSRLDLLSCKGFKAGFSVFSRVLGWKSCLKSLFSSSEQRFRGPGGALDSRYFALLSVSFGVLPGWGTTSVDLRGQGALL